MGQGHEPEELVVDDVPGVVELRVEEEAEVLQEPHDLVGLGRFLRRVPSGCDGGRSMKGWGRVRPCGGPGDWVTRTDQGWPGKRQGTATWGRRGYGVTERVNLSFGGESVATIRSDGRSFSSSPVTSCRWSCLSSRTWSPKSARRSRHYYRTPPVPSQ